MICVYLYRTGSVVELFLEGNVEDGLNSERDENGDILVSEIYPIDSQLHAEADPISCHWRPSLIAETGESTFR
jgi:hypothetical protein